MNQPDPQPALIAIAEEIRPARRRGITREQKDTIAAGIRLLAGLFLLSVIGSGIFGMPPQIVIWTIASSLCLWAFLRDV